MAGVEAIVGLVALGIAVPTAVETFVSIGRYLIKKVGSAPRDDAITKIEKFAMSLDRGKARITLELAEDLYCDTPDGSLRSPLSEYIEQLRSDVLLLDKALDKVVDEQHGSRKKGAKEVLNLIDKLDKTDTSFREFLDVRTASKVVPSKLELRSNQFQVIGTSRNLQHSPVKIIKAEFVGASNHRSGLQDCVLEEKQFPGEKSEKAYERAKELGRLLEFTKASEGLLELAGFQVVTSSPLKDDYFRLIFPYPANAVNPRSLRDILLDPVNIPVPPIPRNFRFILPRKLAEAVYHVHRHNLVHKSIRPETILIFEPESEGGMRGPSYPEIIGTPFLTGWQYTRKAVEPSNRKPEVGDWAMALYQHPERQVGPGLVAESKYNIGHDIYSLGVCLLEIGLWTSFLSFKGDTPSLSTLIQKQKDHWKAQNAADMLSMSDAQIEQKTFLALAGDRLAFEMGEVYSKMVMKCLSCLEKGFGNVDKFVNSESKDWDDQGVLFIQKIREELTKASTMGSGIYNRI